MRRRCRWCRRYFMSSHYYGINHAVHWLPTGLNAVRSVWVDVCMYVPGAYDGYKLSIWNKQWANAHNTICRKLIKVEMSTTRIMTVHWKANILIWTNERILTMITSKTDNTLIWIFKFGIHNIKRNIVNHAVANWLIAVVGCIFVLTFKCMRKYLAGSIFSKIGWEWWAVSKMLLLDGLLFELTNKFRTALPNWFMMTMDFFFYWNSYTLTQPRDSVCVALTATVDCAKIKHMQFTSKFHINWLTDTIHDNIVSNEMPKYESGRERCK